MQDDEVWWRNDRFNILWFINVINWLCNNDYVYIYAEYIKERLEIKKRILDANGENALPKAVPALHMGGLPWLN